jgi:PAT family beta-lactamase induction signal transducer AmpG
VIRIRDVFSNIRVGIQLPLGFASGLPLALTASTLKVWLATLGIDIKTIGFVSLVAIAYTAKPAWAPLLDRYPLPFLGRRRGWMLVWQLLLIVTIATLGGVAPQQHPVRLAIMAIAVAFCSASQDIVVDAYRTDLLKPEERAAGMATFQVGYRIGLLLASAVALVLVHRIGWRNVYLTMAASMMVGVITTLLVPEPGEVRAHTKTIWQAFVRPFADLVKRPNGVTVLLFVLLYRFGAGMASNMTSPFLIKIGFTPAEIGVVLKGVGLVAILVGGVVAGLLLVRIRLWWALLIFGASQAAVQLLFAVLAVVGKNQTLLIVTIASDNFFVGLALTALDAYLMSLCNQEFSATQFAALASVATLGTHVFGALTGVLVAAVGWPWFFVTTSVLAIPALLVLFALPRDAEPVARPSPE